MDDNEDNMVKYFDYLESLNNKKINILKKNELNELRKFVKYQELSFEYGIKFKIILSSKFLDTLFWL